MNALLKCQLRHDNAEPEDDSSYQEAVTRWIENNAEQLVLGCDVLFLRRHGHWQGVTQEQFIAKIQEHLVQRQIDGADDGDWFAQLVAAAYVGGNVKIFATNLLGPSGHVSGKIFEIAEALLEPYASDGLIADAEDDES
ncbi:hypothetical protein PFAS1_23240 [Pseudomonas frederiksbergensis]|uniref:hypothetical protein n=1 Tax=Pseudomonas frederiksbergensis TaxID=104087 RepID=UPI0009589574|nr:hypothetical protein [Pseudomonas frederiksbergensis]APV42096.1 hypothetical protein PFAS1_23240 [Pseudomonas frederiksbergensis]